MERYTCGRKRSRFAKPLRQTLPTQRMPDVTLTKGLHMPDYTTFTAGASHFSENIVTVAKSLDKDQTGNYKILTKQVLPDNSTIAFSNAYYYDFYPTKVEDLHGLYILIQRVMANPRCCIVRSEPRDRTKRVRRTWREPATLNEFPMQWFAIDVDNYDKSTKDIKQDAYKVLLALGWQHTECFAIASSSYGLKSGINLRMFFWNQVPIDHYDLKSELSQYDKVVDLNLFHPIQPIFVAPPIYIGRKDPIPNRLVWLDGMNICTMLPHRSRQRYGLNEERYSKQSATNFMRSSLKKIMSTGEGDRHQILVEQGIFLGKLVGQGHFELDYMIDMIMMACDRWHGKRDRDKDYKTTLWAVTKGCEIMSNDME